MLIVLKKKRKTNYVFLLVENQFLTSEHKDG